jgi:hypothetical protein
MNVIEYQLNYDKLGNQRKYKLNQKRRTKIIDNSSWIENDLKNQWIFRDYKSYYIVITMYKPSKYTVTLSGYKIKTIFNQLERAKSSSFRVCDWLTR